MQTIENVRIIKHLKRKTPGMRHMLIGGDVGGKLFCYSAQFSEPMTDDFCLKIAKSDLQEQLNKLQ